MVRVAELYRMAFEGDNHFIDMSRLLKRLAFFPKSSHLRFRLERFREQAHISLDRALVPQELHICPINLDLPFSTLLKVLIPAERSEAPILGNNDLLTAGELVLRTAEGFDGSCAV